MPGKKVKVDAKVAPAPGVAGEISSRTGLPGGRASVDSPRFADRERRVMQDSSPLGAPALCGARVHCLRNSCLAAHKPFSLIGGGLDCARSRIYVTS
ncbi:MAG: hypothetical protein F4X97_04700 [Boseongicola sp. SB0662_bin_57]|nr:hypothetical protein [Boseongicola sp. SB0662_bin_57]